MVETSKIIKAQTAYDWHLVCDLLADAYEAVSGESVAIFYNQDREKVTVKIGQSISKINVASDSDLGFFSDIVTRLVPTLKNHEELEYLCLTKRKEIYHGRK